LVLAVGTYFYLYQGHRDVANEETSFQITSGDLISEFQNNSDSANAKYLNKTIEVKGKVMDLTDSTLSLESGVFCSFNEKLDQSIKNKLVTVKGRCIGFDELFGEIKLDQCTITE